MAQLITIGKVLAPYGVQGDVRILPLTDFPDRFFHTSAVYLDNGTQATVTAARRHGRYLLLHFAGYDTPEAAAQLRGSLLRVPRAELVPLPPGHYYVFDIIGLSVYTADGRCRGTITDVLSTGSNDVYVVTPPAGKDLLVPALKQVVLSIDIDGGRMTIKNLEEWLGYDD